MAKTMRKSIYKPSESRFVKSIKEAQKDIGFIKEIKEFVKAATRVYKLD